MPVAILLERESIGVIDYRCDAGPGDLPFPEVHQRYSISYVRRGSFGCTTRGHSYELVAGSLLVGAPGDEYVCSHDHHDDGDECLSFHFSSELADTLGPRCETFWHSGGLPPLPELMVLGELAQTIARIVGFKGRFVYDATKPDGTPRKLLDVGRMTRLGWRARIPLEEGLRQAWQWYRKNVAEAA